MGWRTTDPMKQREQFIVEYLTGRYSFTELCERYGIARKTGYKWVERFERDGFEGLVELSRAPHHCPHKTDEAVEELVVKLHHKYPHWGASKLKVVGQRKFPKITLPAASTIHEILQRHGRVSQKHQRRTHEHPGSVPLVAEQPNDVWCIDFKGEFRLGDATMCYPLTLTDAYSRFILCCKGLRGTEYRATRAALERVFRQYGLPAAIRSDNGVPFASSGLLGLSRLNVWFMKLGIAHQRIDPGRPQQNGRHERMHRTLKNEVARPPRATLRAQQRCMDIWVDEFNIERPHEALAMKVPSKLYRHSTRAMPRVLRAPEYAGHMEIRRVGSNGMIKLKSLGFFLSGVIADELVALEEVDDGIWSVFFYDRLMCRIDERMPDKLMLVERHIH